MTKKELIARANDTLKNGFYAYSIPVYHCKAEIMHYDFKDYSLLKSYNTIVGIYSHLTGTMYVFNYYSATTYQHIYKACKLLGAMRITWLYQKSDNIIETSLDKYVNTIKLSNKQFKELEKHDYSCYIETKAFR